MKAKRHTRAHVYSASALALLVSQAAIDPVAAQDTAQAEDEEIEQIIVTGSRLTNTAVSSPVPLVQIGAEEISNRGVIRIEEMINRLPQAVPGQNANISNGANGTSTLNLRGLGPTRTLVLINGKRLPFGAAFGGAPATNAAAPNVDLVPTALVERVDVVTGGASAVYGSDAVGGVVNFVLKDDFQGLRVDGAVGVHHASNQSDLMSAILEDAVENSDPTSPVTDPGAVVDGREVLVSMTAGSNFDDGRGNVTIHVAYQNANQITQDNRDFSACALSSGTGVNRNAGCAGSSNFRKFTPPTDAGDRVRNFNGRIINMAEFNQLLMDGTIEAGTDFSDLDSVGELFQQPDGTLVPRGSLPGVATTFNFGPFNFFRRPNERFNINALAQYQLSDTINFFTDLSFMNNKTDAQIAPSASFNRPFMTNCDNPLLQEATNSSGSVSLFDVWGCQQVLDDFNAGMRDDVDIAFVNSHRNVEGGPRISSFDLTTWRIVAGFEGTLAGKFDWDLFGQFARVIDERVSQNDLNFDRTQQALFIVDDGEGGIACRDTSDSCSPWNIFARTPSGETLIGPETTDFIQGVGVVIGETEQRVVGGTIQTDLTEEGFKSPFADVGVNILGGFEYRQDFLETTPDDISRRSGGTGLTGTGGGTLPVDGEVEVWEVYMETQIPLVENQPMIDQLAVNGAFRHSEYKTNGSDTRNSFGTNTFFVGGSWAPTSDIRFRVQFQRAIRAPNVIDLFAGLNTGLFGARQLSNGAFDPCGGPNPEATLAQCQNTGLTAAQYGNVPIQPAGQLNTVSGGNPDLLPEVSDTLSIGVVWTPEFAPGLSFAADYFDIQIDDAIDTVPEQTTLDECIATGNPVFCDLIVRDRFGSLWLDNSNFEGIRATDTNIAQLARKGIDFQLSYDMSTDDIGLDGLGTLYFDLNGTYLIEDSTVPLPGEDRIDCEGLFSGACGVPNPQWRHFMTSTWSTPWDIDTTLTWRFLSGTDNSGTISDPDDLNLRVPAENYIDLVIRYQATDRIETRLGVNNLFGNNPHFLSQGGNGNVFVGQYDLDRFIFFGITANY